LKTRDSGGGDQYKTYQEGKSAITRTKSDHRSLVSNKKGLDRNLNPLLIKKRNRPDVAALYGILGCLSRGNLHLCTFNTDQNRRGGLSRGLGVLKRPEGARGEEKSNIVLRSQGDQRDGRDLETFEDLKDKSQVILIGERGSERKDHGCSKTGWSTRSRYGDEGSSPKRLEGRRRVKALHSEEYPGDLI